MNYIKKVRYLKERQEKGDYNKDKYYIDVRFRKSLWQSGELEKVVEPYSYIPESYIEFVQEFDNLGLSFVTFYGSKHIRTPGLNPLWNVGLVDYIEELSEYANCFKYDYFPFAKDADGSVFAFNRNQEVVYFDIEDYLFEQVPEKIADNFEEFVGDYVLGPKCDYNHLKDNNFTTFLQSLSWV